MKAFFLLVLLPLARSQNFYRPYLARQIRSNPPPAPYQQPYAAPAIYDFAWGVLDSYTGNDFGHAETRNDQKTTGSYHVALPDGRVQKVTYSVDGYGGYTAEVTYDGTASYPEVAPYKPAPAPYKPAPAPYKPAPAKSAPLVKAAAAPAAPVDLPVALVPEEEPEQKAQPVAPAPAPTPAASIRRYNFRTSAPEVEEAPVEEVTEVEEAPATEETPAEEETYEKPAASYYYRFY